MEGGAPSGWEGHALAAATALIAAAATTALVRAGASRLGFLAHPNSRSSHATPTPTGGGLGFIIPTIAWLLLSINDYPPAMALVIAGVVIAAVGLVDDVKDLRRDIRLAIHIGVAAGCVISLSEPGFVTVGILIIGLAWWINVYNFMDGIDGIAACQAIAYAGGALLLGDLNQSAAFAWLLLAATLGFLLFNWAPAKVFMGDVGSGFLGVVTGSLALWLWQSGELPFVASAILLVGFWFDASYTLAVRIVTRQPFADAHRSHLYQVLSRRLGHGWTTSLFGVHAVAWLIPWAGLAVAFPEWGLACLVVACLPIACACAAFKAGVRRGG